MTGSSTGWKPVSGCAGLREAIRVRRHFTPADFETRYLSHAGSLYGFASHGVRAAFQRPALQPPGKPNFYFVGGSTHPGGGLPLVCLSGQMVADKIPAHPADRPYFRFDVPDRRDAFPSCRGDVHDLVFRDRLPGRNACGAY